MKYFFGKKIQDVVIIEPVLYEKYEGLSGLTSTEGNGKGDVGVMDGQICLRKLWFWVGGNAPIGAMTQGSQAHSGSTNTIIFMRGLDSNVTNEDPRLHFSQFGEVVSIKILVGEGLEKIGAAIETPVHLSANTTVNVTLEVSITAIDSFFLVRIM